MIRAIITASVSPVFSIGRRSLFERVLGSSDNEKQKKILAKKNTSSIESLTGRECVTLVQNYERTRNIVEKDPRYNIFEEHAKEAAGRLNIAIRPGIDTTFYELALGLKSKTHYLDLLKKDELRTLTSEESTLLRNYNSEILNFLSESYENSPKGHGIQRRSTLNGKRRVHYISNEELTTFNEQASAYDETPAPELERSLEYPTVTTSKVMPIATTALVA